MFILFLQILFYVGTLSASPDFLTLQSKITQPDGQNLEATSVNFRITITDPVGTCIVYQEDFSNVNMSSSKGLVSIKIGSGTRSYPVAATTMKDIFKNFNSPVFTCLAGGNYTAAAADQRKLIMQFNDGSGWQTVPSMEINSTPFSLESLAAQRLGAFPAADYVRTAQFTTCGGGEAVHFNGTNFTCVTVGGAASYSSLTSATSTNTIDNTNYSQTWNWSTATTQNPMTMTANTLTTGSLLNLTTSNNSLNSTNGILNVANTGSSTSGTVARIQSNSTAGSGLTVLANGNVGIGTTNPGSTLDVAGTINSSNALQVQIGTKVLQITTDTSYGGFIAQTNGNGSGNVAVGVSNNMGGSAGAIAVGIGNSVTVDSGMAFGSSNTTGFNAIAVGRSISNSTAGSLMIGPSDAAKMTILSSGNVGIGTTTPSGILDVQGGTAAASTNGSPIQIFSQGGGSGNTNGGHVEIRQGSESGSGAPGSIFLGSKTAYDGTGFGYAHVNIANPSASKVGLNIVSGGPFMSMFDYGGNVRGSIYNDGSMMFNKLSGTFSASGNLTLDSTTDATKGYVLINPSGGNVGIGTVTPAAKLDVVGRIRSALSTSTNFESGVTSVVTSSGTGSTIKAGDFQTTATGTGASVFGVRSIVSQDGASASTTNAYAVYARVNQEGSYASRITNAYGLYVTTGSVDDPQNGYGLYIDGIMGLSNWGIYQASASNPNYLAGNVGIGTTSPDSKLQVDGHVWPETTATSDLGSSSLRWNNIYLSNAPDVSSDARLKKDVKDSDLGLEFINSLRPVSWIWKDANQGSTSHYGVIAQETERAVRKAKGYNSNNVIVSHNEENDSYSVRYTELISPLIKAVQELYSEFKKNKNINEVYAREAEIKIQRLEFENAVKTKELEAMKARLEKIEEMINSK